MWSSYESLGGGGLPRESSGQSPDDSRGKWGSGPKGEIVCVLAGCVGFLRVVVLRRGTLNAGKRVSPFVACSK